jgi:hypothetical protein
MEINQNVYEGYWWIEEIFFKAFLVNFRYFNESVLLTLAGDGNLYF